MDDSIPYYGYIYISQIRLSRKKRAFFAFNLKYINKIIILGITSKTTRSEFDRIFALLPKSPDVASAQ
jgi:hypothetical protein